MDCGALKLKVAGIRGIAGPLAQYPAYAAGKPGIGNKLDPREST